MLPYVVERMHQNVDAFNVSKEDDLDVLVLAVGAWMSGRQENQAISRGKKKSPKSPAVYDVDLGIFGERLKASSKCSSRRAKHLASKMHQRWRSQVKKNF